MPDDRILTERQVAEELNLDRLELYLLAASERLGRHDPVSHLMIFSEAEVEKLAERLNVRRQPRKEPSPAELARIPEPEQE